MVAQQKLYLKSREGLKFKKITAHDSILIIYAAGGY